MTMSAVEFTKLVQAIHRVNGRVTCDNATIKGWMAVFSDMAPEMVRAGFEVAMRHDFDSMPSAAAVRIICIDGCVNLPAKQWSLVVSAVQRWGPYKSVNFQDCAVNAVIRDIGGWNRLCTRLGAEVEQFVKRDFEAAYDRFRASPAEYDCSPLMGIHQSDKPKAISMYAPPHRNLAVALVAQRFQPKIAARPDTVKELAEQIRERGPREVKRPEKATDDFDQEASKQRLLQQLAAMEETGADGK